MTRLSIVSQLLAYSDLYAVDSLPGHRDDIIQRADFVLLHYNEVLSHTAFDGMTGYALLEAYEVTGDRRYFDAAQIIALDSFKENA